MYYGSIDLEGLVESISQDMVRGLRGEQVVTLADSFRFESCIRRQRLLDILQADAANSGDRLLNLGIQ